MAGVWLEGWETHTNSSQLARKYATLTGSITVQAGRVFGNSGGINALVAVTDSLGLDNTFILGFGVRIASQQTALNSGAQGLYCERSGSEQFHIEFQNNAGSFEVKLMRGATQVAITSALYGYGVWHHFELKATALTSGATYELRHDEALAISGSGANLANSGSNQWDIFAMRFTSNVASTFFTDDINIKNGAGSESNDFLGDFVIEGKLPNANGTTIQWTNDAGSGSNFNNVQDAAGSAPDESGPGGTNSSDTSGQKDLYNFADLTQIDGAIAFVQVGVQMAMAAAGSRDVKIKYRDDGGTEADAATVTVASTAYDEFFVCLDQNPAVPGDWDVTDINGGQWGVEVV